MKKLFKIIIWTLVLCGLSYAAYNQLEKNKTQIEEEAKLSSQRNAVIPVITESVASEEWQDKYDVIGNFAPYKQVAVMSEAAGKVVSLNFDNGSYVKKGSTLLSVDADLLNIQLRTTKTNLKKAESDLARLKSLLGDGGVTQQQVDDAQLAIDNLQNQIESIEKQISMTMVKAPISGIVSNKVIEKGSLIAPSMQLAQITNIDRLKLQVYLTENQIVNIKKGQNIKITPDIMRPESLTGKVTFIDVKAGTGKRYLVEIEIPNRGRLLKAGMTATAYFEGSGKAQLLAIPRSSVVGDLQDAQVFVIKEKTAHLRNIQTGRVFGDKVEVKDGLTMNETIVVTGQINLSDGMEVSIAN